LAPVEVNSIIRNSIKESKKGGGKPSAEQEDKAERAIKREEEISQKVNALESIREKANTQEEIDAIDERIGELQATTEEKKEMAEVKKDEKERKQELLTDPETGEEYDNETELKRYNPSLYNENFGPQSEWYQEHKEEKNIQKKLNQEIRKMEDLEQGYTPPVKTKKRNSDGTVKRSSYKSVRRDAKGNIISSYSRTRD
jgi:hypothetical protein